MFLNDSKGKKDTIELLIFPLGFCVNNIKAFLLLANIVNLR